MTPDPLSTPKGSACLDLQHGTALQSASIRFRIGYDGNEFAEQDPTPWKAPEPYTRCTFVLSTYYPDVFGGYYENWELVGLIQDALEALGLRAVIADVWQERGVVPVEARSSLRFGEHYMLVTSGAAIGGHLRLWQYNLGGGGPYYDDDLVVDILLNEETGALLKAEVARRCTELRVVFEVHPTVSVKPVFAASSWWRRWIPRWRG